jgi:hypothetical protein
MSEAAYSIEASTSSMDDTSAEVRRRGLSRRACCELVCGSKVRGEEVLLRWRSGEGGSESAYSAPYTSWLERRFAPAGASG